MFQFCIATYILSEQQCCFYPSALIHRPKPVTTKPTATHYATLPGGDEVTNDCKHTPLSIHTSMSAYFGTSESFEQICFLCALTYQQVAAATGIKVSNASRCTNVCQFCFVLYTTRAKWTQYSDVLDPRPNNILSSIEVAWPMEYGIGGYAIKTVEKIEFED